MKRFELDARGLECPKPLLRTKQTISGEQFDELTVLVSNVPARENVSRFLKKSGFHSIQWEEGSVKEEFSIKAIPPESDTGIKQGVEEPDSVDSLPDEVEGDSRTILIGSSRLGRGEEELGQLLLKGYIYTLTQMDVPPSTLIFMNSGISLTLEGSDSLEDLLLLEKAGVTVLVCGTCLDFMKVRDKMKVGRISNMYEIAEKLNAPGGVITLT